MSKYAETKICRKVGVVQKVFQGRLSYCNNLKINMTAFLTKSVFNVNFVIYVVIKCYNCSRYGQFPF